MTATERLRAFLVREYPAVRWSVVDVSETEAAMTGAAGLVVRARVRDGRRAAGVMVAHAAADDEGLARHAGALILRALEGGPA